MEETKPFQQSRKRPLEQIQNTPYYKMRVVLKDLRPHFIEVLKTPDFQNCSAAGEIREGMKVLMDLYKEMTAESVALEKSGEVPDYPSNNIPDVQKPVEHQQDAKSAENTPPDGGASNINSDHRVQGTYIVGGSAFGWNFVTFQSSKSVYYGRTKESFRATNVKPDQ